MAKKIIKRKKIKIIPLLIVVFFLATISFGCYCVLTYPIKNIVIRNTKCLNDDYVIKLADIYNYPSFYLTNTDKIKKKLKKSQFIKNVKIKRKFFQVLIIEVEENIPLYIENSTNLVVFSDGEKVKTEDIEYTFRIPRLMNYVPDNKYSSFIKGMNNISKDILGKISDIEYQPNDIDKDRFLLYMDDGNMVYLTLTKFKQINYYNEVLGQLEQHKGILYLDSGNHFQIKE